MAAVLKRYLRNLTPDRLLAWSRYRRHAGWRPLRAHGHGLERPLYITLTSFPPRFSTLHLTLKSLLRQRVSADGVLLWIADTDLARLPRRIRSMRGVTVLPCADVRSYKKLVFALEQYADAYLVTADDDVFYRSDWLETLVAAVDGAEPTINCHRAHRIILDAQGNPCPYKQWGYNVQDEDARRPSTDLLPVGVGGVLYPPGSLSEQVTNQELFLTLAPQADDLWFFCMGRLIGTRVRKVGGHFHQVAWPSSQETSLQRTNIAGGNDEQFRDILNHFVIPIGGRVRSER